MSGGLFKKSKPNQPKKLLCVCPPWTSEEKAERAMNTNSII